LVHQVLALVLTHFKIGSQLNRRGWARFFTQTAENAAREVDAEKLRVPAAIFSLSFLQRDTAHRTRYRTQVTGNATLFAVRIAGKHDTSTVARRQIYRLFRIHLGFAFCK